MIRIATLGGSTTATGYPKMVEDYLNENRSDGPYRFEVLNLGLGFYTSAHSLVNFVLNVIDFSPDYVVIHQVWNDRVVRNAPDGFRNDYSHAL